MEVVKGSAAPVDTKADGADEILSLDAILAEDTTEYAIIEGFKPGQKLRIRSLTSGDMIEWTEANEGEAKRTAGLRLITKSLVDQNGKLLCTDKNIADFRKKSHKSTENIIKEILKLNGLNVKITKTE